MATAILMVIKVSNLNVISMIPTSIHFYLIPTRSFKFSDPGACLHYSEPRFPLGFAPLATFPRLSTAVSDQFAAFRATEVEHCTGRNF